MTARRVQRFSAHLAASPGDRAVIAIPFDPDQVWGAKADHPVTGQINGRRVRGRVTPAGRGWVFTLTPMWLRDAGAAPGGEAQVELEPEGPQRADLADDIAEVVDLLAAGIKQRPRS